MKLPKRGMKVRNIFLPLFTLLLLGVPCLLSSCKKEAQGPVYNFGSERYDTAALHVALAPNRDCLAVFYAKRAGLFDSVGVKVQIVRCDVQGELDTLLLSEHCDGGWSDHQTLTLHPRRVADFTPLWQGTERFALFVSAQLRIKDVKALKGRTLALPHTSAEATWMRSVVQGASMRESDLYYPQIHSRRLRAAMLTGNQVDATVLSWPYSELALAQGHRSLLRQNVDDTNGAFVVKKKARATADARHKWNLFERARRMALDSLRKHGPEAYSLILQKDYGLPKEVSDSLKY